MKKFIVFLLIITVLAGCSNHADMPTSENDLFQAIRLRTAYFSGDIGNDAFDMSLYCEEDGTLSGSITIKAGEGYKYLCKGKVTGDTLSVELFDALGNQNGSLTMTDTETFLMDGEYTNNQNEKTTLFSASLQATTPTSRKDIPYGVEYSDEKQEVINFAKAIRSAVQYDNVDFILRSAEYPLQVTMNPFEDYKENRMINTADELKAMYAELFTEEFKSVIANAYTDYMVTLDNGSVLVLGLNTNAVYFRKVDGIYKICTLVITP